MWAWQDALATKGLKSSYGLVPSQSFAEAFPAAMHISAGFSALDSVRIGTGEFTPAFLEEAREATKPCLCLLSAPVHRQGAGMPMP